MKFHYHLFATIPLLASAAYGGTIEEYPNCNVPEPSVIGDGICQPFQVFVDNSQQIYWQPFFPNVEECGFDGGDCQDFNSKYSATCIVPHPEELGNGVCRLGENEGYPYNIEDCGFDGGDCLAFNEKYPNCPPHTDWEEGSSIDVGDGICDRPWHLVNSPECGFEGGDCVEWNEKYPNCNEGIDTLEVGNGKCSPFTNMNTEECGFDGGDCQEFNEKYPKCKDVLANVFSADDMYIGTESCIITSPFNVEECGFHDGLCSDFNQQYPGCAALFQKAAQQDEGHGDDEEHGHKEIYGDEYSVERIGDGVCNPGLWNTEECGFDGGDCLEFNKKYPTCNAGNLMPYIRVGPDECSELGETAECGAGDWDWTSCGRDWSGATVAKSVVLAATTLAGIAGLAFSSSW